MKEQTTEHNAQQIPTKGTRVALTKGWVDFICNKKQFLPSKTEPEKVK